MKFENVCGIIYECNGINTGWLCPVEISDSNHRFEEVNGLPNIKSAKKRVLVTETKTMQNKMFKTALRTSMKKYEAAIEAGDKALAAATYKDAVKKIDKAVARNIIHKNAAARKKSSFTKKLNALA